jgi:hypothetical protein
MPTLRPTPRTENDLRGQRLVARGARLKELSETGTNQRSASGQQGGRPIADHA